MGPCQNSETDLESQQIHESSDNTGWKLFTSSLEKLFDWNWYLYKETNTHDYLDFNNHHPNHNRKHSF